MIPTWQNSLHSDGTSLFLSPNYPQLGEDVTVKLRVFKTNPIWRIWVRTIPDGEPLFYDMTCLATDAIFEWWQTEIRLDAPLVNYRFLLEDDQHQRWHYNQAGCWAHEPPDDADFKIIAGYHPPAWLHDRIFYQIFPDRFCDGDPAKNVREGEYTYLGYTTSTRNWGDPPPKWATHGNLDFFGGDLAGIQQQICYLQELGVNALYLNPIFEARSNHKYDPVDYFKIDAHFGTNAGFARLIYRYSLPEGFV